jgi:hypothetical protein
MTENYSGHCTGRPKQRGLTTIWAGSRVPEAHNSGMVEISRAHMLEVSVTADRPPRWEWQVSFNGEMLANGFEDGRIEAQFEGYNAMFLLLAAGWNP